MSNPIDTIRDSACDAHGIEIRITFGAGYSADRIARAIVATLIQEECVIGAVEVNSPRDKIEYAFCQRCTAK